MMAAFIFGRVAGDGDASLLRELRKLFDAPISFSTLANRWQNEKSQHGAGTCQKHASQDSDVPHGGLVASPKTSDGEHEEDK